LHSADHTGSDFAVTWLRPSINTTRVRATFESPGPAPPGSGAGSAAGASYVTIALISVRRSCGNHHAITPSAHTAIRTAIL